jgi:hypothetical protein
MRSWTALFVGGLMFVVGVAATTWWQTPVDAQGFTVVMDCGGATPQVRTTLYFGTTRPKGAVSELEWQLFVRDEVTKRFPDGLTMWDANGQWRSASGNIDQERSKILLLVHADTAAARAAVQELIAIYRRLFDQEAVLWESSRVCMTV